MTEWDIGAFHQQSDFPVEQLYRVATSVHCHKLNTSKVISGWVPTDL